MVYCGRLFPTKTARAFGSETCLLAPFTPSFPPCCPPGTRLCWHNQQPRISNFKNIGRSQVTVRLPGRAYLWSIGLPIRLPEGRGNVGTKMLGHLQVWQLADDVAGTTRAVVYCP